MSDNLDINNPNNTIVFGQGVFKKVQADRNPMNLITGPMPVVSAEQPTGQSPPGPAVIRSTDLVKNWSDTVQFSLVNPIHGKGIIGNQKVTGQESTSGQVYMRALVNRTRKRTIVEYMAQHRTTVDQRIVAQQNLSEWFTRITDQRKIVHAAGARGTQNLIDWEVPLASDPDFAAQMINPVFAPTLNRRFIMNGGGIAQGTSATVANVTTSDILSLQDISDVISYLQHSENPLIPVNMPQDEYQYDWEPAFVMFVQNEVWELLKRPKASVDWKGALAATNAWFMGKKKHPLFDGQSIMWGRVLIKPFTRYAVNFAPGSSVIEDTGGTDGKTYTETTATTPSTTNLYIGRSLLFGAQALVHAFGNQGTDEYAWQWHEEMIDAGSDLAVTVSSLDGVAKLRFRVDGIDTDLGVAVIDSYAPPSLSTQYHTAMAL
jgi:hypothetical protein